MKAIFEYCKETGEIKDKNGLAIFLMGAEPFEPESGAPKESSSTIDGILKLKSAGFTAEEIILMNNSGM
jgi:hypothetical protein